MLYCLNNTKCDFKTVIVINQDDQVVPKKRKEQWNHYPQTIFQLDVVIEIKSNAVQNLRKV